MWWSSEESTTSVRKQETTSDVVVARADDAVFAGTSLGKYSWPPLPPRYFNTLGVNAIRWGGSKSQKYEVPALKCDKIAMSEWAKYRFNLYMSERRMQQIFTHVHSGELPTGQTFEKYDNVNLAPPTSIRHRTVYHGTFAECLCRIAHTGELAPSQPRGDMGHECRTTFPAVFTADTMAHAMQYAWPSNFLLDNTYYGVMLELVIDGDKILEEKRGEVLVPAEAISIKALYLLTNMHVGKGTARSHVWNPALEILPMELAKYVNLQLTPHNLKHTNWY